MRLLLSTPLPGPSVTLESSLVGVESLPESSRVTCSAAFRKGGHRSSFVGYSGHPQGQKPALRVNSPWIVFTVHYYMENLQELVMEVT